MKEKCYTILTTKALNEGTQMRKIPDSLFGRVTPVVATYQRIEINGKKNADATTLRLKIRRVKGFVIV